MLYLVGNMKNLNWENLLEEQCPMCGWSLEEKDNEYTCNQHKEPYRISKQRFTEIRRDLQEKEDFGTDFMRNF